MAILFLFILWIFTGVLSGVVAADKGHSFGSWAVAGFVFGPFGLIAVAGLSDRNLRLSIRRMGEKHGAIESKKEVPMQFDSWRIHFDEQLKLEEIGQESFKLPVNASDEEVWEKVYAQIELHGPEIASIVDKSASKIQSPLFGGKEFWVYDANNKNLAYVYSEENADDN